MSVRVTYFDWQRRERVERDVTSSSTMLLGPQVFEFGDMHRHNRKLVSFKIILYQGMQAVVEREETGKSWTVLAPGTIVTVPNGQGQLDYKVKIYQATHTVREWKDQDRDRDRDRDRDQETERHRQPWHWQRAETHSSTQWQQQQQQQQQQRLASWPDNLGPPWPERVRMSW